MRTHLFRGVCAVAVVLAMTVSAFAQSVVRGKVQDAKGQPVEGATIVFEADGTNRKMQTNTDKKGEFLQVGLQSGAYTVTASKDGIGTANSKANVRQGPNNPLNFTLAPAGAAAAAGDRAAAQKLQALAGEASAALRGGDNDLAIAKFNEVIGQMPTCGDCYYNIGVAQSNKKDYAAAEAAYKKAIEIKPDHGDAYTGLATLYNQQKKFDLAAEASANAAKYAGAGGGGGNAEASYNQGVILFNGQKFAEAKAAFEAAVKADPNHALAQYQLGMTSLNLGQIQDAVNALEAYLKVDPNGPKAAEVKASLPALQGMLKK
jgi:tetratricopeptide (TPR) repeat protein